MRSLDPLPFQHIANHPEVRPWLGGQGELDLAPIVENTDNYAFLTENKDGGYLLIKKAPGLYEAHTMALRSARGRPMFRLMQDGFGVMFMATDCIEVVTLVPKGAENVSRWADLAGFREVFTRPKAFMLIDEPVDASYRSLDYLSWCFKDDRNRKMGEDFHTLLHNAGVPDHPDDPAHDYVVGATIGGCMEGNIIKSMTWYNRWAAHAGYFQPTILSVNPPMIDQGNAIIQIVGGRLDVLKVRH